MNPKTYYVYILTNQKNGTLYTGVTSDLVKRVFEHKSKAVPGFTVKYDLTCLVYYEEFDSPQTAISREKTLKRWKREWKLEAITKMNPDWVDLFDFIAS